MRIDSHHSFNARYPLEYLRGILARNRFDGSIAVVSHPAPVWHIIRGAPGRLDEYCRHPQFCGVCCTLEDGLPGDLAELAARRIPLDLELEPRHLPMVPEIAGRFPDMAIVLDHLARPAAPLDDWAAGLERAARFPNVYCKTGGVHPPVAVRHALAVFGPNRLMFGSDWPEGLPDTSWKAALAAFTQAIGAQPVPVREELLGGTATRVYHLVLP